MHRWTNLKSGAGNAGGLLNGDNPFDRGNNNSSLTDLARFERTERAGD